MTSFNDTSGIRIEDLFIHKRAYSLLEELAVVKNRTVEQLIEDYILAGLHSDIQNHQALGVQYANYLREKHQYDSRGRWKVYAGRGVMPPKNILYGANKPLRISLPICYWDVLFQRRSLKEEKSKSRRLKG